MSKTFWAIIAVIVVIFGGVLVFKGNKAGAPTSNSSVQPTHHVKGTGKVTLVEYGDYQCPFCSQFHPVVNQVIETYGNKITFQFRNLPLIEIHKNAYAAARAAEAAGLQNKYFEMYDLLYSNQSTWGESNKAQDYFNQYASDLHLDMTKFKKDATSNQVNDMINADVNAFNKLGYQKSTPTFILDGKKITPGYNVGDFNALIDAELLKQNKSN